MAMSLKLDTTWWAQLLMDNCCRAGNELFSRSRRRTAQLFRRVVLSVYDPLIKISIGSVDVLCPLSHNLSVYRVAHPKYDTALPRIAAIIEGKYGPYPIVDIGANIGDSAIDILSNSHCSVLCIEGDSRFFDILTENSAPWGPRLVPVLSLVGEKTDILAGTLISKSGTGHIRIDSRAPPMTLYTLSDVLLKHSEFAHFRLLKIDTDGWDFAILRGAIDLITNVKPIIFFEYDPRLSQSSYPERKNLLSLLVSAGYRKAIFYTNYGDYFMSVDLSNSALLLEIDSLVVRRVFSEYFDVLLFSDGDLDLFAAVKNAEADLAAP
jgi:FkbM family methyltransferase